MSKLKGKPSGNPFQQTEPQISPNTYLSSSFSVAGDIALNKKLNSYLDNFNTPEDKQAFDNYKIHNILKGLTGTKDNLFNTYEPMKASFNENAKSLTIEDTDTPEQKTGKDIWNRMVKNGGYLPENDWLVNRAKETMTAGWGDLINEPFQIFDTGLGLTDEGLSYNGDKLKLSSEESDFLAKAFARDRGQDRDKSFVEKIGETAVSLTMDIPLMLATGGIAGGLMKGLGGATGKALFTASKGFGGYLNKVVQQSINFNILGMPQTVKSLNKGDYGQAAEDVFHNVLMGSLGATTTEAGKLLFANKSIPIIKNILKDSPAFKEEIAGVAGGFGFGFTSSKFAGQTNEDALATGLAFAATHFTSPQAYKRVLSEHKNKGVRIRRAVEGHKFGATEYFQEENGKFHKIDADLFNTEGRIVKMEGYDPIDITKENDVQFPYYNEAVSPIHQTFNEALTKIRREKRGDEMAGRIKKAIGEDKWNEDPGRHQLFADMLSTQLEVEKINKIFSSWKLPEDAKLHNEMIKLSDNYKLPYSEVKRVMLEDIGSYIRNPEAFTENLFRENIFGEQFAKDYNKSLEMAHKLLVAHTENKVRDEVSMRDEAIMLSHNPEVVEFRKQFKSTGSVAEDLRQMDNLKKAIADKLEKQTNALDNRKNTEAKEVPKETKQTDNEVKQQGEEGRTDVEPNDTSERKDKKKNITILKTANKGLKKLIKDADKGSPLRVAMEEMLKKNNEEIKSLSEVEEGKKVDVAKILLDKKQKEKSIEYNTKDEIDNRKAEIIKEVQKGQKVKEPEALEMVLAKNTDAKKPTERTKELIKEYNELDKKSIELKSKQSFNEKVESTKTESVESNKDELAKKRIKNLQEDFNAKGGKPTDFRNTNKELSKKLEKYKVNKLYKVSRFAEDFKLNSTLSFAYKLMDELGVEVRVTDFTTNPASYLDNVITISKKFLTDKSLDGIEARYNSRLQSSTETLSELIAHEMMHPILKSPKFADLREKGEKLAEEIYAQYKKDIAGEKIDYNLDERIQYMTGQDVLPGERPFGFEELFAIGLNEPVFARYLDSIPSDIKIDNKPVSMFGRLKDIVRSMYERILGKGEASKLDELSNLLDNMLTNENKTNKIDTKSNQLDRLDGVTNRSLNDNSKPIQNYTEQLKTRLALRYGNKIEQGFASLKHDRREVGERKLDDTEDALKYTKLMADVQMEDTRQAEKSKTLMTGKEAWNIVSKSDKLISLYTGLQKYADLNVPPVFYASMSKKFQELVYAPGEEMIRGIPLAINTILLDHKNWNGGKSFSKLIGDFKNPTPEGQHFLDSFRAYERGRESGTIDKELTWDEFADNFNMSAKERKVLDAYQNGLDNAITRMKDLKAKHIIEFTENPADGLGKKAVSRLLGNKKIGNKELAKARAELNARSQEDMKLKKAIADEIVNKQYRGWGTKVYYNSIRPIDPKMWMVDLVKKGESLVESTGETEETSKRISTYFESKEEASQFIKDKAIDGYAEVEGGGFHQIKDLISNKEHYNKLNAHQLMELANAGHIPLTNDIIKQLMDATKGGVDLHTIRKEYIEGMKYTAEEFENQFDRFVREAIYGGSKAYALTKIDRNLEKWQSDIDPLLKTTGHRQKEAKRAKDEFEYAQRYANQLRQAEHSYVDGIRGVAINFQVGGIKPSFIFQQASQVFQTTFHQGIADAKKTGLTTGDAIKSFNKALGRSIKAGVKLRAINNGEEYADADMSAETVELLQKLERMNKIGGTGISELTAEVGDLEYKYEDNVIKKNLQSLQKIMNLTGKSVEKWSRIQTALTFEDIGRKQGLKGDDLLNFMADGIDKSLAEWGKGGRAPVFDSKVANTNRTIFTNSLAKSFLTYKTFSYYNYGMWRSMIRNKQFSALASKIVIGTGMHGITKFPLFASAGMIADLFFEDDELDWKMWQVADSIDEIVPEAGGILHRGVGSVFGIDFRDTFGETTPLAPDLYANAWSDTWQGKLVELSLGAPFGFTQDAVKGVSAFKDWAWDTITNNTTSTEKDFAKAKRAWLRASPVFIRNVFNAFTLKENGLQMNGKTMVFSDELSTYDIVAKAMSFPIDKLTRGYTEYSGGVEKQYTRAKQILKKGATHRKEFIEHLRKEGIKGEAYTIILREEMKRVAKDMREARLKIKELEPQVKLLKRKRKQTTN